MHFKRKDTKKETIKESEKKAWRSKEKLDNGRGNKIARKCLKEIRKKGKREVSGLK